MPEVGDMAARLGLSISDPEDTIGCDAMESLYWLTRILLHQRGKETHPERWTIVQMLPPTLIQS